MGLAAAALPPAVHAHRDAVVLLRGGGGAARTHIKGDGCQTSWLQLRPTPAWCLSLRFPQTCQAPLALADRAASVCQHPGVPAHPRKHTHAYLDHVPLLKLVENFQPLDARAVGGVQVSLRQTPVSGACVSQVVCVQTPRQKPDGAERGGGKEKKNEQSALPLPEGGKPHAPPRAQCA